MKMNNKGQALVMFVILLPVILMAIGFVVDISFMNYNKHKLDSINKTALNYIISNKDDYNVDKVEELILKNDDNVTIFVDNNDKEVVIKLNKNINSVFGNIIGLKSYEVESYYKVDLNDEKIIKIEE